MNTQDRTANSKHAAARGVVVLVLLLTPATASAQTVPTQRAVTKPTGEDGSTWTAPRSAATRLQRFNGGRGAAALGGGTQAPNVAVVASAAGDVGDAPFVDPQSKLLATGLFNSVTLIHAGLETPSVDDLKAFDALLVWSNFDFLDAEALGDNLADYVDDPDGGGVVLAVFATTSPIPARFLDGRWRDEGYHVLEPELGNTSGSATLGAVLDPASPLLDGVTAFDGGSSSFRPNGSSLQAPGVVVAEWSDGVPLVAFRDDLTQRRVDLGFYPPSDDVLSLYWNSSTDGDLLLANALIYAADQIAADVRLELLPLSAPSAVTETADLAALPGQLAGGVCPDAFVLELWVSDVGVLNTGVTGMYVDLAFDNAALQADALVHSASYPVLNEGAIDNGAGMVINFGGADFTQQGLAPSWVKLGHVEMSVIGDAPTTITSSLGLGGVGVFGRPPPPEAQVALGIASCEQGVACNTSADCADLDGNGIRDDPCVWWSCSGGTCAGIEIDYADLGGNNGACPPDGTADGNDRFHALNCFSNQNTQGGAGYPCELNPPTAYNVDAAGLNAPCDSDGVCDGNDAFAALNAFEGIATCTCGPAPQMPAPGDLDKVEGVRALLIPTTRSVAPGATLEVDIYLEDAVIDLRGYQLHAGVSGARGPRLLDLSVEHRADAALPLRRWAAFNAHIQQMVVGLDGPGIDVAPPAYLGTLTYHIPVQSSGILQIDLLYDPADVRQRTALFVGPQRQLLRVIDSTPARVTIR